MCLAPVTNRPSNAANFRAFSSRALYCYMLYLVYFLKLELLVTCYYTKIQPPITFFLKKVSSPSE